MRALHLLHPPGNCYVGNTYLEDVMAIEFVEK